MPRLNGLTRSRCASLWVMAALSLAAMTAHADTATFAIEPQDLSGALKAFAVQSHREIFFAPELARGRKSQGVKGKLDDLKALNIILEGTGLNYSVTTSNAILVRDPTSKGESSRDGAAPTTTAADPPVRVAKVDQNVTGPSAVAADQNSEKKTKDEGLSEIVVTGTQIRGAEPVGSSLKIYSRSDLDQSGAGTLEQFARQMPENFSGIDAVANLYSNNASLNPLGGAAANSFGGAAFDLRGLGPSSTLTLLNGHRLAAGGNDGSLTDISLIPLSAIDHIEVLTDGASAVYGTDAVAGVVNIITRKNFNRAETAVRYGGATEGGNHELTASQTFGRSWDSGNVFLDYEYEDQMGLDASQRDYIPAQGGPSSLLPENRRNSVFASGAQTLGDATTLSASAIYSTRILAIQNTTASSLFTAIDDTAGRATQSGGTLALTQAFSRNWDVDATANFSRMQQSANSSIGYSFGLNVQNPSDTSTDTLEMDIIANGSLFALPGGTAKTAFGGSFRRERFDATAPANVDTSRQIFSAFGEILVPIFGEPNRLPWATRLELSVAARYDDYSDFGSTTNPKIGILWEPVSDLGVRATYGTSFRAPLLNQLATPITSYTFPLANPNSPTGTTDTLQLGGGNPNLVAEKSRSFTTGLDLHSSRVPGLYASATYFNIRFTDRISTPPTSGAPSYFTAPQLSPFIQHNPSLAEVESYFNSPGFEGDVAGQGPAGVMAIFNGQFANLAATRESGVDLSIHYEWATELGDFNPFASAERLIQNNYQTVASLPFAPLLNTFGEPPKWKARGGIVWKKSGWVASIAANYTNGYQNSLFSPSQDISSWLTEDLNLSYDTTKGSSGVLSNVIVTLSVLNLTEAKPPYVAIPAADLLPGVKPLPYDAANASPIGRFIALQILKRF